MMRTRNKATLNKLDLCEHLVPGTSLLGSEFAKQEKKVVHALTFFARRTACYFIEGGGCIGI